MSTTAGVPPDAPVRWSDVVVAVVVGLFTILGAVDVSAAPLTPGQYLPLAGAAAALVPVRRWPVGVFAVVFALHLVYIFGGHPEAYEWLATAVALGGVARAHGWRPALPIALVLAAMSTLEGFTGEGLSAVDAETLLAVLGLTTSVVIGEWLRTRQAYLDALHEQAALAERTREQEARRRADEERLRIAREVHDVVAHAIASINVQAGVGEHVATNDPDQAVRSLADIRHASGEALGELRAVLGTLRHEDGPREPTGRLDDVDRLVQLARDAGLATDVTIEGRRRPLPPGVEQAGHRILQEAVTNAVRHAGDASLSIRIAYAADAVDLHVEDDGAGGAGRPSSAGHGLRGMHERAAALGGTVHAGPREDRGFVVRARLPVRPEVDA